VQSVTCRMCMKRGLEFGVQRVTTFSKSNGLEVFKQPDLTKSADLTQWVDDTQGVA